MYKLENIQRATIVKRPSAYCKTPYVADIITEEDEKTMGHTPALGCCGLCDKDASVLITPSKKSTGVCNFRVDLSILYDDKHVNPIIVGTNPKLAEELIEHSLQQNLLGFLNNLKEFRREKKIEGTNSRFDFVGIDVNNKPFVMEVKNVPLADYVDCTAKERKKMTNNQFDHLSYNEKIAYFPDGYRKNIKAPVSPRALKHLHDLSCLSQQGTYRTIMCYVVQREDVSSFQPSVLDEIYREAFYKARENGVEMYAIQFSWSINGVASLICDNLKINEK